MSSSKEARLFYLPGTSDYLLPLVGDWLQFVKLRLLQLETTFTPLLALLFAVIGKEFVHWGSWLSKQGNKIS